MTPISNHLTLYRSGGIVLSAPQQQPHISTPAPKPRSKWLRRIVAGVLVLVAVIALGYPAAVPYTLTHPVHKPLKDDPASYGLNPESISFPSAQDGLLLKGWYFASPTPSDRTIVMAHGYAGNRTEGTNGLKVASALLPKGFNIVMFDFRSSGQSPDDAVTLGLRERWDEVGAVRYAQSRGAQHVGVIGFSMGAHTSIMAMAEDKAIQAAVIDAPYGDLHAYLADNMPKWTHLPGLFTPYILWVARTFYGLDDRQENALTVVGSIAPRPILFIHGLADNLIPASESEKLYKAANNPKDALWLVPGAGHVGSLKVQPDAYLQKVTDFLDQNVR